MLATTEDIRALELLAAELERVRAKLVAEEHELRAIELELSRAVSLVPEQACLTS